jgi:PAS domain S-box-containing protein
VEEKVNILLVDDVPANLFALRELLADLDHNLVEAKSGEEALRCLLKDNFALVLLDVHMPSLDGFETAKLIRGPRNSRYIPIIFVTAGDIERSQIEEGYALGAVDFLVKPLVPFILKAKVRGFIELFQDKQRSNREAEQLRLLVQGTADYAIFMLDREGNVVTWNSGAEHLKGYGADEIIGQHFSRFYPPDAIDRGWPAHELRVARTEGRFEDEGWRVRKDGTQFWANVIITALRDEQGALRGFSKITRDLTERKRAEDNARLLVEESTARRVAEENARIVQEQRERLHVTLESIGDGVISTDVEGRVEFLNSVAQELVGWKTEEAANRALSDVFRVVNEQTRLPLENPALRALQDGVKVGLENHALLVARDGREHSIDDSAAPIRNAEGKVVGSVLVFRDISPLKQANEALRDADRRKDEFLATLAHELRNPLAPIRNSLQILKMPRVETEIVQQTRDVMERQVHQLVRLVDDLLDVSRVMRGKIDLRLESVELATVIARAVEMAQPLIEVQGHKLDVSVPNESLLLDADPVRLTQVVANLLTNSAKYTQTNGDIWLTARREGDQAVLRVRDTGIGIAPDMLPHVFELFVQADHASTRAQGGLGIGLTLVKKLVELHGGNVEAHSAGLGEGCEFVVRLPLKLKVQQPDVRIDQHLPAPGSGHRVLIVDDNHDAAISFSMLLRLRGHDVQVAHDGPSALKVATTFRPKMIFLDLGMPGMDGYEVARRVRKAPGLEKTVLAALTGWGQQEDRRRTTEAGFDHHLVKPPEPKAVEKLLADLK